MNESAVLDAQRNALINDVKNCRFVCGKVRLIYPYEDFLRWYSDHEVILYTSILCTHHNTLT
jgi:tRNA/tmRNA/rRNA uracil-C5-methylase (TrmA/RlmC/RlmD family)